MESGKIYENIFKKGVYVGDKFKEVMEYYNIESQNALAHFLRRNNTQHVSAMVSDKRTLSKGVFEAFCIYCYEFNPEWLFNDDAPRFKPSIEPSLKSVTEEKWYNIQYNAQQIGEIIGILQEQNLLKVFNLLNIYKGKGKKKIALFVSWLFQSEVTVYEKDRLVNFLNKEKNISLSIIDKYLLLLRELLTIKIAK